MTVLLLGFLEGGRRRKACQPSISQVGCAESAWLEKKKNHPPGANLFCAQATPGDLGRNTRHPPKKKKETGNQKCPGLTSHTLSPNTKPNSVCSAAAKRSLAPLMKNSRSTWDSWQTTSPTCTAPIQPRNSSMWSLKTPVQLTGCSPNTLWFSKVHGSTCPLQTTKNCQNERFVLCLTE